MYICTKYIIIAIEKLNIDKLKSQFKDKNVFDTNDIATFYTEIEEELKRSTVNWRIYAMVQNGVLQRVGRGKFKLGKERNYFPEISSKMKLIYSKVKKEYPYTDICIWNTSSLNEFMIHQPFKFYYVLELEKEAMNSIFYFLKNLNFSVFLEPTTDILEKYAPDNKQIIIIKPLISEAPLISVNGIKSASIEKMLVDIFCDTILFSAQQGSEMRTIFETAFTKYTINQSKMLRYANRRRKKEYFTEFINSISNIRQQ
ncbi:DUF6577 family protein [Flavobacterium sp. ZS1P14]|uniref:DUF6577 family protein n=1 Tax=Flavobacterium sp. ZS1P14 TaxID=3401729 RepID=UPI003AAB7815